MLKNIAVIFLLLITKQIFSSAVVFEQKAQSVNVGRRLHVLVDSDASFEIEQIHSRAHGQTWVSYEGRIPNFGSSETDNFYLINCKAIEMCRVLYSSINCAIDSTQGQGKKWLSISVDNQGYGLIISGSDSGIQMLISL